jgi:hypothetical protein
MHNRLLEAQDSHQSVPERMLQSGKRPLRLDPARARGSEICAADVNTTRLHHPWSTARRVPRRKLPASPDPPPIHSIMREQDHLQGQ